MNEIKNISLVDQNCTGCGLCSFVCPNNAIRISEDYSRNHFLFPIINNEKCINCGQCLNQCPVSLKTYVKNRNAFLFQNSNKQDLINSSSGGAFIKLAKFVLSEKGVVYGAGWNKELQVEHMRATCIDELFLLQKSKYIQSKISKDIFLNIKQDIADNKFVLFVGTPCQCAAVSALFKEKPKKLLIADIICHGVPNQWLFNKNVNGAEKFYKGKMSEFSFRYKDGAISNNRRFRFVIEKKHHSYMVEGSYLFFPYYKEFHEHNIYRESCYSCNFRDSNRFGDITLADYWGIEKLDSNIKNSFDKSLLISNTPFGEEIIKKTFGSLSSYNFEQTIKGNSAYLENCKIRNYKYIDQCGSEQFVFNTFKNIKKTIKKNKLKNLIKRILNLFGCHYQYDSTDYKITRIK